MAVDVIMPQMGESIFEGTITKWLKKPGDKVERDEPLFEISTDKVDAEIPSPSAGVLKEIKVTEGQTVPIQTVVASIDAVGGAAAASAPAPAPAKAEPPKAAAPAPKAEAPAPAAAPAPAPPAPAAAAAPQRLRRTTATRFAAHRSSAAWRANTTSTSRRCPAPVPAAASASGIFSPLSEGGARLRPLPQLLPPAPSMPPPSGGAASGALENGVPRERMYFGNYEVQPMTMMRQNIAEHMVHVEARFAARLLHRRSGHDADRRAAREDRKRNSKQESGTKLTFMPFFVRAASKRCARFPPSTRRLTARTSCCTANATSASPWRSIGD